MNINDLLWMGVITFGLLVVLTAAELIKKYTKLNPEIPRKTVHLFSGLLALPMPYIFQSIFPVLILTGGFLIVLVISARTKMLSSIHGVERVSAGAFLYPLILFLLFLLSKEQPLFFVIPVLILLLSDSLAAIVGKYYGQMKYTVSGGGRTLEGSSVFFIVTFIAVHIILLLSNVTTRVDSLLIAVLIAILVTGIEAISYGGWDNMFVPIGSYFFIHKLVGLSSAHLLLYLFIAGVLLVICFVPYTYKHFSIGGSISIFLIGLVFIILGGLSWFLPQALLYAGYSLPSLIKGRQIENLSTSKHPKYTLRRILSISLPSILVLFLHSQTGWSGWYSTYFVTVGAQLAILWNLQNDQWKDVKYTGRSEISWVSILLALLGAILPVIILFFLIEQVPLLTWISITAAGFLAYIIYTLYFRLLQIKMKCPNCGIISDNLTHCETQTIYYSGFKGMSFNLGFFTSVTFSTTMWLGVQVFVK